MSKKPLRILSLGYCFPPIASPESYVTAKTMAAIPDAKVDIVTISPALFAEIPDHSLDAHVEKNYERVERIDKRFIQKILKLPQLPIRPDRYLLMTGAVVTRANKMQPSQYDCLVTRSQPHSIHVAGLSLKRRNPKLPWVASFSDPWSDSPYERRLPILSSFSRRFENNVLRQADALVFPTEEMRDFVAQRYPAISIPKRSHVVPHGFDPALYAPPTVKTFSTVLEIGMFGSFYGPRTPSMFLEAVSRVARDPSIPEFRLSVFGAGAPAFLLALSRYPDAVKCVVHRGMLPHAVALTRMATFDILMLNDAPMPPPSIFLSSKLVDYMGAGRPIFAITPKGASAKIVHQYGGWVVSPDNIDEITTALANAILIFTAESRGIDNTIRANYSIDRIGLYFRNVVDNVISMPCIGQ